MKVNVVERRRTKDNNALFIIGCSVRPCHCLFLPACWSMNNNTSVCLPNFHLAWFGIDYLIPAAGDDVREPVSWKQSLICLLYRKYPTSAAPVVRRSARSHDWPPLVSRDPETSAGIGTVYSVRSGGGKWGYIWNLLHLEDVDVKMAWLVQACRSRRDARLK